LTRPRIPEPGENSTNWVYELHQKVGVAGLLLVATTSLVWLAAIVSMVVKVLWILVEFF
jgi:hypothetical protein